MSNTQQEVFKTFALMILRWIMVVVGTWMIKKGVIDEAMLDSLTAPDVLIGLLGFFAVAGAGIWGFYRARYTVALPKAALKADSGTSLETVKADVKSKL